MESNKNCEKFDEFFLVWESSCRNFIDDFSFANEEARLSRLRIHVFLRKDTPLKALPPAHDWVELHYSLTTCPFASDTCIVAELLQRFGACADKQELCVESPSTIYLIADKGRKYEEVIELLTYRNTRLRFVEIDGQDNTILDILDSACKFCKLVFSTVEERDLHNLESHNFFCAHPECPHHTKRFYTEKDLQGHIQGQTMCPYCDDSIFCSDQARREHMKTIHDILEPISPRDKNNNALTCQFCPERKFTSGEQVEIHMKNCHKKCNCSCGMYFKTRDDYIEHFYTVYPLACFENRKCPHRFQSVMHQAAHHREDHFATHPFYCVPCQHWQSESGSRQRMCFRDEKSLRIHGKP
ncbi:predicted protein [Nematostella vectensis]|uniref:C2H2-type domain-containing protein n=1 Tax=Nematostella vectensis TaxID=45351 RepID=A7RQ61_NEMVE|nr:predicted protein [Nematostella vectensis]|eukprot:XP_001638499.1 predicted protein [Nematostella vectensis]